MTLVRVHFLLNKEWYVIESVKYLCPVDKDYDEAVKFQAVEDYYS